MTFKEKLQKERPEIAEKYFGCPKHLDYEMENIYCLHMSCIECWNREIPGTEDNAENTTKNLADKMEEFICSVCHIHLFDFLNKNIIETATIIMKKYLSALIVQSVEER